MVSRRNFLKFASGSLVAAACAPTLVQASYPDEPRVLAMNNLHTGETLESCYFNGHRYVRSELDRLNHICRDFRRNEVHSMDRGLFDQLTRIQSLIGRETEVQIISGYRSPATNEMLRQNSNGVAQKSYHMLGKAFDFRLDGVPLQRVHEAALALKSGGVGYYPKSGFIHIDTGPVRRWLGA